MSTGRPIDYSDTQRVNVEYRQRHSVTLHPDTADLELVGHRIYTYAKKLNILNTKIVRKRNKTVSKLLEKCENDYDETYTTLEATVKELNKLIPTTLPDQDDGGYKKAAEKPRHIVQSCSQLELEEVRFKEQLQQQNDANRRVCELEKKVELLQGQLRDERSAKNDLTKRLNEQLSLRNNNPIEVDVSDKFRPTKIAEQISELYDIEWTDAFDELEQERYSEKEKAQLLLDVFMDVYHECRRISTDGFLNRIKACIEHSDVLKLTKGPRDVELPDQFRQQVNDIRKQASAANIDNVVDGILNQTSLNDLRNTAQMTQLYVRKCANLSWMMCIQNPPMMPSTHAGREIDTSLFREYTKKGSYVDYVVWPVIYLHEEGPVLCKGIAQCSTFDIGTHQFMRY